MQGWLLHLRFVMKPIYVTCVDLCLFVKRGPTRESCVDSPVSRHGLSPRFAYHVGPNNKGPLKQLYMIWLWIEQITDMICPKTSGDLCDCPRAISWLAEFDLGVCGYNCSRSLVPLLASWSDSSLPGWPTWAFIQFMVMLVEAPGALRLEMQSRTVLLWVVCPFNDLRAAWLSL